jgi:chorismate mutase
MELRLDRIATLLEGLEETIIGRLIDRAQFAVNEQAYAHGKSGFVGEDGSLFELRLRYQEEIDSVFGRFCVPEERPFTNDLPPTRRDVNIPDTGLRLNDLQLINACDRIQESYLGLLPTLCRPGNDGQYGSSVEHDVMALQAMSRRIHFGALYVAECKYRDTPADFDTLITAGDTEGLVSRLTRPEVEERIITRVGDKVETMQARVNKDVRVRVEPSLVMTYYRDTIIPVTKQQEVAYLVNRERTPPTGTSRRS